MKKRLLAAIMSLCMVVSLLPVSAFAADGYEIGDVYTSEDNPNPELPTNIPAGTEWVGPVTERGQLTCEREEHTHTDACYELICEHVHDDSCYPTKSVRCTRDNNSTHWEWDEGWHGIGAGWEHISGTDCEEDWFGRWYYQAPDTDQDPICGHHSIELGCYKVICGHKEHTHDDSCYHWTYTWTLQEKIQENDRDDDWRNWWPIYWSFDKYESGRGEPNKKEITDASLVTVTAGVKDVTYTRNEVDPQTAFNDSDAANVGQAIANSLQVEVAEGYYLSSYRVVCGNYRDCGIVEYDDATTITPDADGDYSAVVTIPVSGDDFSHNDLSRDYPVTKPGRYQNWYGYDYNNQIFPYYLLVELTQDTNRYQITYDWGQLAADLSGYAVPNSQTELLRNQEVTVAAPSDAAVQAALAEGYVFDGWYIDGTGYDNGATIDANGKVVIRGSDLKLSAKWVQAGTPSVENVTVTVDCTNETAGHNPSSTMRLQNEDWSGTSAVVDRHLEYTVTVKSDRFVEAYNTSTGRTHTPDSDTATITYVYDDGWQLKSGSSESITFEVACESQYTVAINTQLDDGTAVKTPDYSVEVEDGAAYDVEEHIRNTIQYRDDTYALDYVEGDTSGTVSGADVTITAVYSLDEKGNGGGPDGVPDKYQKEVTYVIKGGTWDDGTTANKVEYVTLTDGDGNYSQTGSGTLKNVPTDMKSTGSSTEDLGWTPAIPEDKVVSGTDPVTYTYNFGVETVGVKVPYNVEYYFEQEDGTYPQTPTNTERYYAVVGTEVTAPDKTFDGYCLNSEKSVTTGTIKKIESLDDIVTLKLYYDIDKVGGEDGGGDGIPDKYQKKVTYVIKGGTWADDTTDNKVEYVTLTDRDGNYSQTGSGTLKNVPTDMEPTGSSAEALGWTPVIPEDKVVSGTDPVTYTYNFGVETVGIQLPYNVEYYFEQEDETYSQDTTKTERNYAAVGTEVTAEGEAFDGYCLNSEKSVTTGTIVKIESLDDIVTLKLYYDIDKVGGEDGGDGIPDRYQKKVTFKVVNGTWDGTDSSDKIVYVTLETNGKWDVNGSGTLTAPTGMQPNVGYTEGAWEDETPPATVTGTEDATYTYRFTAMTYYTVTYDPNEGTLASGAESVTVAKGWSVNLESVAARDDYIFMGWTTDEIPGKIYHAGDPLPDKIYQVGETFTPEKDTTVYAVWGEDTNGDDVADAQQVLIKPEDITVYRGGTGYESVVGDDTPTTGVQSSGLPEPGYSIVLPHTVNEELKKVAESAGDVDDDIVNLTDYLTFNYEHGDVTRTWKIETYDRDGNSRLSDGRYIYRILPAEDAEGQKIPIRLLFTNEAGEEFTSDDFFGIDQQLYDTLQMTIYAGDLKQDLVRASVQGTEKAQDVGVGTGELVIRGTTGDAATVKVNDTVNPANDCTVTAAEDNAYYVNGSPIQVQESDIRLLVDDLAMTDDAETALQNAADGAIGTALTNPQYEFKYLDLVDYNNGNAYVTLNQNDEGDYVTVNWSMPANADPDTIHVVHFDGMDREFDIDQLNDYLDHVYEIESVDVNGDVVSFNTSTFSPFVLVYETKAEQPDPTPDPDPGNGDSGSDNDNDSDPTGNLSIELDVNGGDDDFTFTVILTDRNGDDLENNFYYNGDYTGTIGSGDEITLEGGEKIVIRNLPEGTRYEVIIETADGYTYVIDGEEGVIHTGMNEAEFTATRTVPVADPSVTGVSRWLNTTDHIAYLTGYPGGTFGPDNNMTRAEVAQMFYALLNNKNVTITKTFPDVPADAWYATAVNTLASLGMVSGDENGNYRPNDPITRAEFCVIALAFAYEPENAVCYFGDVSRSDWFYTYVAQAASYGWIGGYTNGNFGPNDRITRAQVTTIVNNMLGRAADRDYVIDHQADLVQFTDLTRAHWGYFQIMEATNAHDYTKSNGTENWR